MDGLITGENDERIGLSVIDNNDVEHVIEMEFDGEIKYHDQDVYPFEPNERTATENEHINQARRFAKYWVYRKRGYETLEPRKNPDRLLAAVVAIAPLTPEATEEYFGDLYHHFQSAYGEGDSPVEMPDGVAPRDAFYQQEIYLGLGDGQLGVAAATALSDPALMNQIGFSVDVGGERPDGAEFVPKFHEIIAEAVDRDPESMPSLREGLLLDAVSDVHVQHESAGRRTTVHGDRPDLDRKPDARLETYPFEPGSITDFQIRMAKHLVCQVRDCYLTMGIAPPEPYRIQGYGFRKATGWYNTTDFYQQYADPDVDIDTWFEDYTPEDAYEHEGGEETVSSEA